MSLVNCVVHSCRRQPDSPPLQLVVLLVTFKSRFSVVLLDRQHCHLSLLGESMGRQRRELNDSARKKVMKRRHRWTRIATCQWKHRQMRISGVNHIRLFVCQLGEWNGGIEKGEMRKGGKEDDLLCLLQIHAIQGVLGFLHLLLLQKAQAAYAGQRNVLPARAR